jgi:DNA-binding NtrC family response regulator
MIGAGKRNLAKTLAAIPGIGYNPHMAKVLLLDDEVTMVQSLAEILRREGHEVFPFSGYNAAVECLESQRPELVITDLYLDKTRTHGMEILQKARALSPPATAILITAYATIGTAVDAMKKGAFDYLEKPFKVDDFIQCVRRALTYNAAISENIYLKKQLKKKYQFNQLIGNSPQMQDVFKMIERVADTDSTILILGESGTGKELVARALHFNSRRQFAPFIPINCTAMPENLLESELFGHCKGAFTGAINDKKGLFQEADGGTIFLDEIGSMPAQLQSRLLRVLQEREVRRVGDNTATTVNVRVLSATHERLEEKVKAGTFREDLYYRLNVIPINLPSLRERREDIPVLTVHFLRNKINPHTGALFQITRKALDVLSAYDWPGNVRELENAIERACALCEAGTIKVADLPPVVRRQAQGDDSEELVAIPESAAETPSSPQVQPANPSGNAVHPMSQPLGSLKDFMREQELSYVNRALAITGGDKEKAAQLLNVSVATLYRKLADEETPL